MGSGGAPGSWRILPFRSGGSLCASKLPDAQVSAATKALEAVALGLLDDHLRHCVVHAANDPADLEQKLGEASSAIARLVRS